MKFPKIINNCLKNTLPVISHDCLLCRVGTKNEQLFICDDCLAELPFHHAYCPVCALSTSAEICGNCLKSAPAFDSTRAVFKYLHPIDALLQQYKYANNLVLARAFGRLMTTAVQDATQRPDVLIPMPLHAQRLGERGFNQAVEIGCVISQLMQLPLDVSACQRIKPSPPQASLPLKQRVRNMRNAFRCTRNLDGMRVAILDDVMTTGASLNELAKVVKKAGAIHVECWVIARTQSRSSHV
jgi:ComF family protein